MVLGTVVAVIAVEAEDALEVPAALVAVTVNVQEVDDCKPSTVNGDEDPVAVKLPGLEVAVNEVAAGDPPGRLNVTVAAPLLNARSVPTSVADTLTGVEGCKKSFCCWERRPALLLINSPYYAVRSPNTSQVFDALFNSVTEDH